MKGDTRSLDYNSYDPHYCCRGCYYFGDDYSHNILAIIAIITIIRSITTFTITATGTTIAISVLLLLLLLLTLNPKP